MIGEDTGTDSEAIIIAISKFGIEETVKHLQGAWALVWVDTKENTLNFLRNKERPMWYSYTKDFKQVIWASEYPMIRATVDMATVNQKIELFIDDENHAYFSMMVDWWYRFDLKALEGGSKERPKPKVKELKGKEAKPISNGYSPFHGGPSYGGTTAGQSSWTTSTTTSTTSTGVNMGRADGSSNVASIIVDLNMPLGNFKSRPEFDEFAKYGCAWCHKDVKYEDIGMIIDEYRGTVICPCCSGNESTNRIYTTDIGKYITKKAA